MATFECVFPDKREYIVDYDIISSGSPQGDYCSHGPGDPADPPELAITAIFDQKGRQYVETGTIWQDLVNIFKGKRILSSKDMEQIHDWAIERHCEDMNDDDDFYDPGEWHD